MTALIWFCWALSVPAVADCSEGVELVTPTSGPMSAGAVLRERQVSWNGCGSEHLLGFEKGAPNLDVGPLEVIREEETSDAECSWAWCVYQVPEGTVEGTYWLDLGESEIAIQEKASTGDLSSEPKLLAEFAPEYHASGAESGGMDSPRIRITAEWRLPAVSSPGWVAEFQSSPRPDDLRWIELDDDPRSVSVTTWTSFRRDEDACQTLKIRDPYDAVAWSGSTSCHRMKGTQVCGCHSRATPLGAFLLALLLCVPFAARQECPESGS